MYSGDLGIFNTEKLYGLGKGTLYRYVLSKENVDIYDSGYSSNAKFEYKLSESGTYSLKVYVNDILSILPYEDFKEQTFTVQYAGAGDINVDGTVDIYDLAAISKSIGKKKSIESSWNERLNLEASNDEIDVMDLAKAAKNYNIKY
jgi:hypothetical protein